MFTFAAYIVPCTILLPLFCAFYSYFKLGPALKIIFYYLVISGIINLTGIILALHHTSNLFLLHIYTVFEFLILCYFYRLILTGSRLKQGLVYLMVFFLLVSVINVLYFEKLSTFNAYTRSVEAFTLIALSVLFFYQESNQQQVTEWHTKPLIWMNIGLLIYFTSSLFLFLFSNVICDQLPDRSFFLLWTFHGAMVMVMYMLFTVGFSKCKK